MKTLNEFILDLSTEQKVQIVIDFNDHKNDIRPNNSELYSVAKLIATEYDLPVSQWLEWVGNAVANNLALEYIKLLRPEEPNA